jgi:hypothetical protein
VAANTGTVTAVVVVAWPLLTPTVNELVFGPVCAAANRAATVGV